jgi:FkbM family methyltransferase
MATNSSSHILYSNYLGRLEFIKTVFRSIVCKFLNACSLKHLANGEKQLAAYTFDFIGHQINLKGVYERQELIATFNFLSAHDYINGYAADVGANIGNHSIFFRRYYPKVFSFEPNLRTFKILSLNAELVGDIQCFNIGLSESERIAYLNINSANVGGSYLSTDDSYRNDSQQEIHLKTFDSLADQFNGKLGLFKIDVEGHELSVLHGSEQTLLRDRPVILFEQQVENFTNGKSLVFEYLKSIGYSKFAVVSPSPNLPLVLPKTLHVGLVVLLRLMVGLSYEIKLIQDLPVDSYPFIIALPR